MISKVKKWFREKDYGFIDNGEGPDVMVRKADLLNCKFLKVGVSVEFECHPEKRGLIARKVKLQQQKTQQQQGRGNGGNGSGGNGSNYGHQGGNKPFRFGVMT